MDLAVNSYKSGKRNLDLVTICIVGMFLCCAMIGILPQTLLALVVLVLSVVLMFTGKIYLAFPIMIFYYSPLDNFMGMSVFRYFTFLFIAYTLGYFYKKISINIAYLAVLLIYFIYSCYFSLTYDLQRGIFAFFDIMCAYLLVSIYLKNKENLKWFFTVYVLIAVLSFFTGIYTQNFFVDEYEVGVETFRNMATFEDPNYMGFFFSLAIFSVIALELFTKRFRIVLTVVLTAMILSTLSMTAIIGNILFWTLYLVVTKKINIKTIIVILLIVAVLLSLYYYGLAHADAPVIGPLANRIDGKLGSLMQDDINSFSTGRFDLTQQHLNIFSEQTTFKKLFGFNATNPLKVDLQGSKAAAHNEYVDLLLNIGILGTVIFIGFALWRFITLMREYISTKDKSALCFSMIRFIWFYYAFTLTLFMDNRFAIAFLI